MRVTAVAWASIEACLAVRDAHDTGAEATVGGLVGGKPADLPLLATTSGARLETEQISRILKSLCAQSPP